MNYLKSILTFLFLLSASHAELTGTMSYNELQKLTSTDEMQSISVNDELAVIGIPDANNNAIISAGAVLVYVHNKTTDLYEYRTKIDSPVPLDNDRFGNFVALQNHSIIITNSGQFYYDAATATYTTTPNSIFVYEYHSPTDIRLNSTFNTPGASNSRYADTIYVDGDRFVAMSYYNMAYVYQRNPITGIYHLQGDGLRVYGFNNSFQLQGDYIFIGDSHDSSTAQSNAGAVHVYKANSTSGIFEEVDTLVPSNAMTGDGFGNSIAVSDNTLAIGSTGNEYNGIYATLKSSALHIYEFNTQTKHFEEKDKLFSATNITSYQDVYRNFKIQGNTLIVYMRDILNIYTRATTAENFKISQTIAYPTNSYANYTLDKNTLIVKANNALDIYERTNIDEDFILKNTITDTSGNPFSYLAKTNYKMFIKISDGISISGTETYRAQSSFIERFYQNILGRTADEGGMATWLDTIQNQSAASVAEGFFNSKEFTEKKLNNEDFVDILYQTLFDRDADAGGKEDWLNKLTIGTPRDEVIQGFLHAPEFKNLADSFGVSATSVGGFVKRFYTLVLNREADSAGFNDWTTQLNNKTKGGGDIARGFFNSTEYTQRNLSDSIFLDICYRAFFDRESDAGGKLSWLTALSNGTSKDEILTGFINSEEFANLTASYGIIP